MPTTKRGAIFVLLIATVLAAALASPAAEADPARTGSATTASATHFSTLLPGSSLPSDQTCAGSVRPVNEQRIDNVVMNDTVPPPGTIHLAPLDRENGYDNRAQTLEARVTGNFTGTTDEIIQWAACKWGFDENVVRAIAMTESDWHQDTLGDYTTNAASCPPGLVVPCPQSFGIHQVTWTSDPVGTWPWSQTSTAFNLDASLMVHRLCYEGYMQWLTDIGYTSYKAGDLWGCVGQWYSGAWHDGAAQSYVATVKNYVAAAPWTQASFSNVPPPPPPTSLRYDFENGSTDGWYPAWGPVTVANTTNPVHTGSGALAINLNPSGPDWPAIQVSSPPALSSGTKVTYWIYQPLGATLVSVAPYAADLNWNDVSTPAVTLSTGWNDVTWTVPAVDGIAAIGLQVNDNGGWNGRMVLDSVNW